MKFLVEFLKIIKKRLDKTVKMCYNKYRKKERGNENVTKNTRIERRNLLHRNGL